MSRPRKGRSWLRPRTRGPSFSDMPKRMIICFDVEVTRSRSLAAPGATPWQPSSPAAGPRRGHGIAAAGAVGAPGGPLVEDALPRGTAAERHRELVHERRLRRQVLVL